MLTASAVMKKRIIYISITLLCTILVIAYQYSHQTGMQGEPTTLVLLLPDHTDLHDPKVTVWLDAAREEGLLLKPMYDSEFLQPWFAREEVAGVILPDQVHKVASDVLIDTLNQYVAQGGRLMLVYDAGIWTGNQRYAEGASRLSTLAGIRYGNYKKLQAQVSSWSPPIGNRAAFTALQVPPGKFALYEVMQDYAKTPPVTQVLIAPPLYSLAGYDHPVLSYDSFVTAGNYQGQILLQTVSGSVAAGVHQQAAGQVLFVNLPLAYLMERTDGMLMHSFLRYFAERLANVPYLSSVPDGVGGLVMNLHLDSNVSLAALQKLRSLGLYTQGPYSIHITAGPDATRKGDGAGLNVPGNKQTQAWIKYFQQRGYAVGSHGGWIHDYWGNKVPDKPTAEFENYLKLNKQALEKVTGQAVIEYSAPEGNHPDWVTDWLHTNGFVAYYFTGNSGMPPTRSYREGHMLYPELWSFPILTYRDMAGFEELRASGVSSAQTRDWLHSVTSFCVNNRSTRLIYFHPRGALLYPNAVRSWLAQTKKLQTSAKFRWYTLSGLSRFLNRRLATHWSVSQSGNKQIFRAENTQSLAGHSWVLKKAQYARPEIIEGKASIEDAGAEWLVHADAVEQLQFSADTSTRP